MKLRLFSFREKKFPSMMKKEKSLSAQDFSALCKPTANIYKTAHAIGQRSKQLLVRQSLAFQTQLEELGILDQEEDLVRVERHLLSKSFESKPKPVVTAIEEFTHDKLSLSYVEKEK